MADICWLFNKSCEVEVSKTHFTQKEIKAHRSKITCPRYLSTESSGMEELLGGEGDAWGQCYMTISTDSVQCSKPFNRSVGKGQDLKTKEINSGSGQRSQRLKEFDIWVVTFKDEYQLQCQGSSHPPQPQYINQNKLLTWNWEKQFWE